MSTDETTGERAYREPHETALPENDRPATAGSGLGEPGDEGIRRLPGEDDPQYAPEAGPTEPPDPEDAPTLLPTDREQATSGTPADATTTSSTSMTGMPAHASSSDAGDPWHDLQGQFVDDPAAAVAEAGRRVEAAFADVRRRAESSDSTEDLRITFRQYRDLHRGLV